MKTHRWSLVAATAAAMATGCTNSGGYGDSNDMPAPVNTAPSIVGLGDQSYDQDTSASLAFTVSDAQTAAGDLVVSAVSSDAAILPAAGLALAGGDAARELLLTPREDATGTVSIAVTVRDGQGAITTRSISATWRPVLASMLDTTLGSYAVSAESQPQVVSGRTFVQDADDPLAFDALLAQ